MQNGLVSACCRGSSWLNQSAATVAGPDSERARPRSRLSLPIQNRPAGTGDWCTGSRHTPQAPPGATTTSAASSGSRRRLLSIGQTWC
jgi:hypothetical protein